MGKVLVTGATGNVGREVLKSLRSQHQESVAGILAHTDLSTVDGETVLFDFAKESTWKPALDGVEKIFLMRPPAISDVKTYLFPFVDLALESGVKQIVFLSLQGVQFNPLTPHYKVEKYLKHKQAPYTFLRPNFFMQNLATFYIDDIATRDEIYLPAGKGKTAFVDVRDIGAVAALVLSTDSHIGKAYTLSGLDSLDYYRVATILSDTLKRKITYKNPSVQEYVERLKSQNAKEDFIKVQKMLYFVVRHNFSSATSPDIEKLLGRKPIAFHRFVEDYSYVWANQRRP